MDKKRSRKIGYDSYKSLIGELFIVASELGVENLFLNKEDFEKFNSENKIQRDTKICKDAIRQLDEYFKGKRQNFEIQMYLKSTNFREAVYMELLKIPYGETRSYSDIAHAINNEKAVRAVGSANRNNPIPIFIPCHRVIGKSGKMVGYAGDRIGIKEELLKLEEENL